MFISYKFTVRLYTQDLTYQSHKFLIKQKFVDTTHGHCNSIEDGVSRYAATCCAMFVSICLKGEIAFSFYLLCELMNSVRNMCKCILLLPDMNK